MSGNDLSQEYLKELFDYKDGQLFYRKTVTSNALAGQRAGTTTSAGYIQIRINNRSYLAHRLIYTWVYGVTPTLIDHVDGNRANNSIENLRIATFAQNVTNSKDFCTNTSGMKNVYSERNGRWRVRLRVNGKSKSFGMYDDLETAKLVADKMRKKYYGEFIR